jgi:hypothetical protein
MVTFINLDSAATVSLGFTSSTAVGAPNAIPLAPGDSITLSTKQPIYAIATAQMSLLVMPGGASYAPGTVTISGPVTAIISGPVTVTGTVDIGNTPSVNIANTPTVDVGTVTGSIDIASVAGNVDVIGTGGTFPVGSNAVLATVTGINIPAAQTVTSPIYDMLNYTSYEVSVGAFISGGMLTMPVTLNWYADAAATQLLYSETGWVWTPSGSGNVINALATGPLHGRYMTIVLTETSGAAAATANYQLYGTGRVVTRPAWRQAVPLNGLSSSGITNGIGHGPKSAFTNGSDGVVVSQIATGFAAVGTYWYPLPMVSTEVSARWQVSAALPNDMVVCSAAGLVNGGAVIGSGSSGVIWNPPNAAGVEQTAVLYTPRAPLYYTMNYNNIADVFSLVINGVVG